MNKISKADIKVAWISNNEDFTRKYRPKKLSEVVGHAMTKHNIKGMVKTRKIPGALLIHGQRGSGKTTFARLLGAMLNCQELTKSGDACQKCSSCLAMFGEQIKHPDYMEVNSAQSTGIDDIRALKDRISYRPRYNRLVVVLDEVHRLSRQAMEGLLKPIEDPQGHVTFILITTEPQGIIDTLQSRCVKLKVGDIPSENNVELLKRVCHEEGLKLGEDLLGMICAQANNIPRECLTMLQSVANALASGEIKEKDLNVEGMPARVAELVGAPNYVGIQNFLTSTYSGKLVGACKAAHAATSKPNFMRGCIETHNNVLMFLSSKEPATIITEKWLLGQTRILVESAGLRRSQETLKSMGLMLTDLIDMYTKMSQYQLGDSAAPLVALASKWSMRFREASAG